jgi:hypothetical protein
MEELKKEYENQDNRSTAWPIYVTVQELVPVGVIDEDYSILWNGEERYENSGCDSCDYDECDILDSNHEGCKQEKVKVGYIWVDIEFFLTIKGAEEYIEYDKHNHGKLRTYVKHFSRRNFEMRKLLGDIGFKVGG